MEDALILTRFRELTSRLEAIERQLTILSERAGVPYVPPPADEVPASVRDLARAGKSVQAIQELMKSRGLTLLEAKRIVDAL